MNGTTRTPMASAMSPAIEAWIEEMQARFDCSRSMVIASACAFAANLKKEETYYTRKFPHLQQSRRKRGTRA